MDRQLDEALCKDFPEIFRNRNGDMRTTAMCWGFECGSGWEPLIRATCERLMSPVTRTRRDVKHIKENLAIEDKSGWTDWQKSYYTQERLAGLEAKLKDMEEHIPVASQVKEKFGGLRFYVHGATEEQYDIIHHAEAMSYYVCEECGTMKTARLYSFGWNRTLCDTHADEQYGSQAADYRNNTGAWADEE
jgi:hypothetical protein